VTVPRQAGFSLLELLLASFLGLLALSGILYLYKGQHKTMAVQGGISEMRMNGQFTLSEAQHYLTHVGLGLPANFRNLSLEGGDMVVRMNPSKRSAAASMDPASNGTETVYRISAADAWPFADMAYAAALVGGGAVEAPILSVVPRPGFPAESLVRLKGSKTGFSAATTLFPVDRVRLHRCTGIGADTVAGDFRVLRDDPGLRPGLKQDTLTLAEGIDSIGYRYVLNNRTVVGALPVSLDSLLQVEVTVVAVSSVQDRDAAGDGRKRDTLRARVGYRRSL
jgi:hypothetical protein